MALTTLKEMAGTRRAKFGTLVIELASPGIGYILKAGGAQFVFLDMEHAVVLAGDYADSGFGRFGFDTVKQLLRYMEAAALPAIVRVPSRHYHHIARALDMGAEGIMTPMVGTVGTRKQPASRRTRSIRPWATAVSRSASPTTVTRQVLR